jgi:hypothetical protein
VSEVIGNQSNANLSAAGLAPSHDAGYSGRITISIQCDLIRDDPRDEPVYAVRWTYSTGEILIGRMIHTLEDGVDLDGAIRFDADYLTRLDARDRAARIIALHEYYGDECYDAWVSYLPYFEG